MLLSRIKYRMKYLWLQAVMIAICATVFSQEVRVNARLDSTRALIGDQVKLHLNAELSAGTVLTFPAIGDTLSAQVEVIRKSRIDSSRDAEGKITLNQDLVIAAFDTGFVTIPGLPFSIRSGDHSDTLHTEPIVLEIVSLPMDTTVRDIKANLRTPISLEETFPYILMALGAAILVILVIFMVKKFRKKEKIITFHTAPPEPSWVTAIRQLEKIRDEKAWMNKPVKIYYIELTDIVRHYLEARFHITALEQTTYEIIRSLAKTDCGKEPLEKLEKLLSVADFVKFAKVIPDDPENQANADEAIAIVRSTIPQAGTTADKDPRPVQNNVES
jgi:hypothetical protein